MNGYGTLRMKVGGSLWRLCSKVRVFSYRIGDVAGRFTPPYKCGTWR